MTKVVPTRRDFTIALAAGSASLAAPTASRGQEEYPTRPIKVVIGFPAGSGADIVTRFFATKVSHLAGQPMIVENKPGASSSIAFAAVGAAKPDGYTILWSGSSIMAGGKHLVRNMPYNPDTDFTPVAAFADFPFILVVSGRNGPKDLNDLKTRLKGKSRPLYGHYSPPANLASAYVLSEMGVKAEPVAYKGAADAIPDLENGTIDMMIMDGAFAVAPVSQGRLRALAVTSAERAPRFHNVPTLLEAGIRGFDVTPWWGAWFPKGTPRHVVDTFYGWLSKAATDPDTVRFLEKIAVMPVAGDASVVRRRLQQDTEMWNSLAKEIGLSPQ